MANDARALPVAHRLAAGAPVWADMHEWAAEEFSHDRVWRTFVAPLMAHNCRTYLPRSAAVTTVCDALAERYDATYGVHRGSSATPAPGSTCSPRRSTTTTSGWCTAVARRPGRYIDLLIRCTLALGPRFSLDLFLVPGGDGGKHLTYLRELAARLGAGALPRPGRAGRAAVRA